MLRHLRQKVVALIMAMVAIVMTASFSVLYYSTALSYQNQSAEFLRSALRDEPRTPEAPRPSDGPPQPRREAAPVLVLERRADGELLVLKNLISSIEDEDAAFFADLADQTGKQEGMIPSQHLRFQKMELSPGRIRYAMADTFEEERALKTQLIHSAAAGAAGLTAFFFASLFLSKRLTAPVEAAWKQQQQFVADASHELKTPLTVILANTELLLKENVPSKAPSTARITRIQKEALRMKELAQALLLLARSDAGLPAADRQLLDLSYLIESSVMAFEPVAFEAGKELRAHIQDSLMIDGNEASLRQLADILLDNACKYSQEGSLIQAELSAEARSGSVRFSVTSQGVPLTEEELSYIFHRFYRADPSRGQIPGFGLGLSIAAGIVKEHGGSIRAASDGIGANTFTVLLPLNPKPVQRR